MFVSGGGSIVSSRLQRIRVVAQVILNETGNEEIAVVVAACSCKVIG
jgi:hypothetical protein